MKQYVFYIIPAENGVILTFPKFINEKYLVKQIIYVVKKVTGNDVTLGKYSQVKNLMNYAQVLTGIAKFDEEDILQEIVIGDKKVDLEFIGFNKEIAKQTVEKEKAEKEKENNEIQDKKEGE